MANNEKIKAAGKVPIAQTYRDTWTSQLFVLADFYNVLAEVPTFADDYTANKAKYATTPAAVRGFQHLEDAFKAGYFNEDFGAATYDDGLRMVATGEAAHYPMLTFAIGGDPAEPPRPAQRRRLLRPARPGRRQERPDRLDAGRPLHPGRERERRGGEGLPRTSSPRSRAATSSPRRSARPAPTWSRAASCRPTCRPAVADMLPYFETEGATAPALEFLSPVKGPALEQITVEVGSGIRPAAEGAALYDQDVEKQAKQLGLPGLVTSLIRRQARP